MLVAVIAQKLQLSRAEKNVINFVQNIRHATSKKQAAAKVLQHAWKLRKHTQNATPVNGRGKLPNNLLRSHQKCLSLAVSE